MPANSTYNDGGLEYGSAVLTITPKVGSGFSAIADAEFSFDDDSKRVEQTNQWGEPLKAFAIPVTKQGSCTIQLPASARCDAGASFTTDVDSNVKVWLVGKASNPHEKEGYRKQAISFFEKLN